MKWELKKLKFVIKMILIYSYKIAQNNVNNIKNGKAVDCEFGRYRIRS